MQDLPKDLYNIPVANVMIPINQSHVSKLFTIFSATTNKHSTIYEGLST